jgi:hypothetical protein
MKKWVFSLDADLTLIELYLFNPALAKFAEISYCIKQEDSDIKYKERILVIFTTFKKLLLK